MAEIIYVPASMGNLYGILRTQAVPSPLLILSHGFGGSHTNHQDYEKFFYENGMATFNLDFCGGGLESKSDGAMLEMTVLTEAEDLNAVIDHFKDDGRFTHIFLIGFSQGGFVSSYVAAQRPSDIAGLVLEYPAFVLQDDARERVLPDGTFPATSDIMGQIVGRVYNEAAVSFDIYDVIGGYAGDVLILHGDMDDIVPLRYSERAAQVFPHAKLFVLPGQGHGFTGEARRKAMKRELMFLDEHR